jgi:hypothetical protein
MAKSRKNNTNIFKSVKNTTDSVVPVINKGLTTVGTTAKGVAVKSAPVVQKGLSTVYGSLATGFDLGIKGAKNIASGIKTTSKKRRTKRRHRGKKTRRH